MEATNSLQESDFCDTRSNNSLLTSSERWKRTTLGGLDLPFLSSSRPLPIYPTYIDLTSDSSSPEKENLDSDNPTLLTETTSLMRLTSPTSTSTKKILKRKLNSLTTSSTRSVKSLLPTGSLSGTRKKSKTSFRLRSKSVFLTFPRCGLEKEKLKEV